MATLTVDKNMLLVAASPPRPFSPRVVHGETLADRYAARAGVQWVRSIRASAEGSLDRFQAFRDSKQGRRPANAIAQRKWVERAKAAFGSSYVGHFMQTGQRGRWAIIFDVLSTCPVHRDVNKDAQSFNGRTSPAWLEIVRTETIWRSMTDRRPPRVRTIVRFTVHSLARAVQRLGVESEADLLAAIREMWRRISIAETATRERRALQAGDRWILPVKVKGRAMVAILGGPCAGQEPDLFLVKSFMPVEWLRFYEIEPCQVLSEALDEAIRLGADADAEKVKAALEALRIDGDAWPRR